MNLQNKINFRFSEYLSEGLNFYTKNFSKVFMASVLMIVLSLIPFCSYLAIGNFMKFMKRLREGKNPDTAEIFNFDDFLPYFKLILILVALIIVMEILILIYMVAVFPQTGNVSSSYAVFLVFWFFLVIAAMFYVMARAFYMPWLISVKNIKSIKEAWRLSSAMSGNNMLIIIGFSFLASFLGQLGIFACFVGILVTMPFYYVAYYFAMEDGFRQVESGSFNDYSLIK